MKQSTREGSRAVWYSNMLGYKMSERAGIPCTTWLFVGDRYLAMRLRVNVLIP